MAKKFEVMKGKFELDNGERARASFYGDDTYITKEDGTYYVCCSVTLHQLQHEITTWEKIKEDPVVTIGATLVIEKCSKCGEPCFRTYSVLHYKDLHFPLPSGNIFEHAFPFVCRKCEK